MIENGGRWSFEGGCQLPVIGRRRRQLPKENTSHCQEESLGKTNCQFKKEFLADESDMYYLLQPQKQFSWIKNISRVEKF